jgi:hypothetical protein
VTSASPFLTDPGKGTAAGLAAVIMRVAYAGVDLADPRSSLG